MKRLSLVSVIATLGVVGPSQAAVVIDLPVAQDTMAREFTPDSALGSEETLLLRTSNNPNNPNQTSHVFIQFDLTTLAGVSPDDIVSATMLLDSTFVIDEGEADQVQVQEVLSSWDDANLTWNNSQGLSLGDIVLADIRTLPGGGDNHDTEIDLTDLVKGWAGGNPNNGIRLSYFPVFFVQTNFASSENDVAGQVGPLLRVEVIPEPGSFSLLSLGTMALLFRSRRADR